MMKKRSFFERLAGSVPVSDDFDAFEDEAPRRARTHGDMPMASRQQPAHAGYEPETAYPASHEEEPEGQLPVDMYQTPGEIVVRTFIAGVRPEEINLSISRDMVVIEGSRAERESVDESAYVNRELFWGNFSRTILLPQEIDVENSSATAKDGLLTLILPKLDKARQTKLRVKAG
jgi:HSP20 family molecular chaperone IbpA